MLQTKLRHGKKKPSCVYISLWKKHLKITFHISSALEVMSAN